MNKIIGIVLYLLMFASVFSCGDLRKEEVQQKPVTTSQFEVGCSLDVDGLSGILTKDVSEELNCLRKWLVLFTSIVKSDRPGELGIIELKDFLKKGLGEDIHVPPLIYKIVDGIGELNYLLGSGTRLYVTKDELNHIMDSAIVFNKEIINLYLDFSKTREVSYRWHKNRRYYHFLAVKRFSDALKKGFHKNRKKRDQVDVNDLLNVFSEDISKEMMGKIRELLVVKQMIVGGKKNVLTYHELYQIIEKLPSIVSVVYDAIKFQHISFKNDLEKIDLIDRALIDMGRDILIKRGRNRHLFSLKELEKYVKLFYKKPILNNIFKSKRTIQFFKNVLFKKGRSFTSSGVRNFITYARGLVQQTKFTYKLYAQYKKGVNLTRIKLKNKREMDWRDNFSNIINKYRFFKGKKPAAILDYSPPKNLRGILEYTVLESLLSKVFKYWEKERPCHSRFFSKEERCKSENYNGALTKLQFQGLIREISDVLVANNIVAKGSSDSLANKVWQLGDLFLTVSNGNLELSSAEMAEFGVLTFSASHLASTTFKRLQKACPSDYKDRIEPRCFKEKFLAETFRNDVTDNLGRYLPRMKKYYLEASTGELKSLMKGALGYTRSCYTFQNGDPIYISSGEFFTLYIGLLNIEAAILKFDHNKNNQLDKDEFLAFNKMFIKTIEETINSMVNGLGNILSEKVKRKILRIIFKNQEIPSEIGPSLGMFIKAIFKKERKLSVVLNRDDFTNVLSALAAGPIDFDYCETLR